MKVATGIDRVAAGEVNLSDRGRVAVLTNYAARDAEGRWSGTVLERAGLKIVYFLAPEHGLDASAAAGAPIPHETAGTVPVLSMYGADAAPVEEALREVDGLIVDLQDVGCRYYTYNWTIREAMRLAARFDVGVTILDRPNPLGGTELEGILPRTTDSPVCASAVPVRHGLTVGELARYNRRYFDIPVDLSVVPVTGWSRSMLWDEVGMPFVPPSPNLRRPEELVLYPGTCLLEGTTISEGRGTEWPFGILGAPDVDPALLAAAIPDGVLDGLVLEEAEFIPRESKWQGEHCRGLRIRVTRPGAVRPVHFGLALLAALLQTPGFAFRARFFDALAGGPEWREGLLAGQNPEKLAMGEDIERFRASRTEILLY